MMVPADLCVCGVEDSTPGRTIAGGAVFVFVTLLIFVWRPGDERTDVKFKIHSHAAVLVHHKKLNC